MDFLKESHQELKRNKPIFKIQLCQECHDNIHCELPPGCTTSSGMWAHRHGEELPRDWLSSRDGQISDASLNWKQFMHPCRLNLMLFLGFLLFIMEGQNHSYKTMRGETSISCAARFSPIEVPHLDNLNVQKLPYFQRFPGLLQMNL